MVSGPKPQHGVQTFLQTALQMFLPPEEIEELNQLMFIW